VILIIQAQCFQSRHPHPDLFSAPTALLRPLPLPKRKAVRVSARAKKAQKECIRRVHSQFVAALTFCKIF
jgi:hypothetical protein